MCRPAGGDITDLYELHGRWQSTATATTYELALLQEYHLCEDVAVRFACNASVGRLDPSCCYVGFWILQEDVHPLTEYRRRRRQWERYRATDSVNPACDNVTPVELSNACQRLTATAARNFKTRTVTQSDPCVKQEYVRSSASSVLYSILFL